MRVPWRREFDPARDFTVRKPVTAGGRKFLPGETFDPSLVTTRRLRQLFDQHTLIFKGDAPGKIVRNYFRHPASLDELERAKTLPEGAETLPGPEGAPFALTSPPQPAPKLTEAPGRKGAPAAQEGAPAPEPPEPSPEKLEAQRAAQERERRAAIEIAQDWERQPWNSVRALAKAIAPEQAVANKDAALAVIADEIAHRAEAS